MFMGFVSWIETGQKLTLFKINSHQSLQVN